MTATRVTRGAICLSSVHRFRVAKSPDVFALLGGNEQSVSYLSSTFVTIRHDVNNVRLSDSIPDNLPVSTSMTGAPCSRCGVWTAISI